MSSTLRELLSVLKEMLTNKRFWLIFAGTLGIFILTGPFGTFERMDVPTRTLYWSGAMLGAWLIAVTIIASLVTILVRYDIARLPIILIGSLVGSLPIALYMGLWMALFIPAHAIPSFGEQMVYTLPISIAFGSLVYAVLPKYREQQASGESATNPLLLRLPLAIRGPVVSLSMQDHYVQVTTDKGSDLILMRMGDAMEHLAHLDGLQIHRSHWVNKEHVTGSRRHSGQIMLSLSNGEELPVSRSYTKSVMEAGLI